MTGLIQTWIGKCVCPAQTSYTQFLTYIGRYVCPAQVSNDIIKIQQNKVDHTLRIFIPGNAYRLDNPHDLNLILNKNITHIINWPQNKNCKTSNELLSYMYKRIDDLCSQNKNIKNVELYGHSLGGHAALMCALHINKKLNLITSKVTTINTFTSLNQAILEGCTFPYDLIISTLILALTSIFIIPISQVTLVVSLWITIRLFFPKLITKQIAKIIKLCGWRMDNKEAIKRLSEYNTRIDIWQGTDDHRVRRNAQLANPYNNLNDYRNITVHTFKGTHRKLPTLLNP